MNAACGDARYNTAPATSSGVAKRFSGTCVWMADIDVLAVYPGRRHLSAKVRAMIDFLERR